MKEQIKGAIIIIGFLLLVYGICCLAEWLSNVITIGFISKVIIVAGIISAVILMKGEK